jgi:hypothetical protein
LEGHAGRETVWKWNEPGGLDMKRFLLTTASLVGLGIAAPAFAQTNDSYIDQVESGNTATVGQMAGGVDNYSSIRQEGTRNTANVVQGGSGGNASSGAGGVSTGNEDWWDNRSWILQYGTGHTADVSQMGIGAWNSSRIEQHGQNQYTKVVQDGESNNLSEVKQFGALSALNNATVEQGGAASISNSSAVTQSGSGNTATVIQK